MDDKFGRFKTRSKELYENTCSQDINGQNISNLELLTVLIKKFENINCQDWEFNNDSIIFNKEDLRFQLWARMEMTTSYYYHNLRLTIEHYTEILDENLKLGYSLNFSSHSLLFKEVYDRVSFFSKFFFDIEYFIQQVNTEIKFIESFLEKKKSHYFKALIEHLEIKDDFLSINDVIEDVNKLLGSDLLIKGKEKNIKYFLIFDYISTLRNCFHNNGYSQKDLNNLDIGGIKINIKKGEQASMNHAVIFILTFMMISILEKVSLKLLEKYPYVWKDKYLQDLKDFVEANKK